MASPKYLKIRDSILNDIRKGLLKQGDILPRREDLIQKYSVTRTTMDKALGELISSGILKTVRRLGTFVAQSAPPLKTAVICRLDDTYVERGGVIAESCQQRLFKILISHADELNVKFIDFSTAMKSPGQLDQYDLIAAIQPPEPIIEKLHNFPDKTIMVNRYFDNISFVATNHHQAMFEATSRLLSAAPSSAQVFYIDWELESFVSRERREGFIEACSQHKLFYRICKLRPSENEFNFNVLNSLRLNKSVPVLMTATSCLATGAVLRFQREKRLEFGKNFFYADFENIDSLERTGQLIPTIVQDYNMMGMELINAIRAKNDSSAPVQVFIPHKLLNFNF
ncbi:MAG: hypothetical protein A2020_05285 [Lentisphaerae bacterium GWF2_45_14]|nr:MAG: hypothetical protein A2020_05285 [Lentisphaerae bacterium GWF2_45_14]